MFTLLGTLRESVNQLSKGHGRDHGGVAKGQKSHVPTVSGSYKFDEDELAVSVDAQQVDAAVEGFHRRRRCGPSVPPEMLTLLDFFAGERGSIDLRSTGIWC